MKQEAAAMFSAFQRMRDRTENRDGNRPPAPGTACEPVPRRSRSCDARRINGIVFEPDAKADYRYWQVNDFAMVKRLDEAILSACAEPFFGPALSHDSASTVTNYWVRYFSAEHALVYCVFDDVLIINRCRDKNAGCCASARNREDPARHGARGD
tara:strand:+ start:1389 stop:1853 length:465 start_codon:yes stop_codon:yes gene_type:complete